MINIPIIELIPRLLLDEDEEEEETEGYHQQVQRMEQRAEAIGTLEVDAEGNQHAVRDECPMHPAEAIGEGHDRPSHESKERAIENPLGEFRSIPQR